MSEISVDRLVAALGDDAEDSAISISTSWEPIGGPGAPVKPAI